MRPIILAAILAVALPATADETKLALTIDIDGASAGRGQIIATLFDSEAEYMKIPVGEQSAPVSLKGQAQIVFEGLSPGDYAVSIVHDADGDGELDTGLFGIPTEKVGFSNNARGRMGPAPWSKAKVILTAETPNIRISLRNAKRK